MGRTSDIDISRQSATLIPKAPERSAVVVINILLLNRQYSSYEYGNTNEKTTRTLPSDGSASRVPDLNRRDLLALSSGCSKARA
jgi:hypothetical protein